MDNIIYISVIESFQWWSKSAKKNSLYIKVDFHLHYFCLGSDRIGSEIFLRTRTSHVTRKILCLFRSDPIRVKVELCLTFSKAFHWKSVGTKKRTNQNWIFSCIFRDKVHEINSQEIYQNNGPYSPKQWLNCHFFSNSDAIFNHSFSELGQTKYFEANTFHIASVFS